MTVAVADASVKRETDTRAKIFRWFERAMSMHLAAGRFSSPAGMIFLQQDCLPQVPQKRG